MRGTKRELFDSFLIGDGCWEWQGWKYPPGYGGFRRNEYAHRAVYEELVGPVPDGLELDHLCRNKGCVRPTHLEPVTRKENAQRMFANVTRQRGPKGQFLPYGLGRA